MASPSIASRPPPQTEPVALASPDRDLTRWAEAWARDAGGAFLRGWLATSNTDLPHDQIQRLLTLFQLTKAFYELNYELNNRPDWVAFPLRGIDSLMAEPRS